MIIIINMKGQVLRYEECFQYSKLLNAVFGR